MKHQSRVTFIIPGKGEISIAGTTGFVASTFARLSMFLYGLLEEALKTFRGELVQTYSPPEEESENQ